MGGRLSDETYIDTDGNVVPIFDWKFQTPGGETIKLWESNDGTEIYFDPDNQFTMRFKVDEKYAKKTGTGQYYNFITDVGMVRGVTQTIAEKAGQIVRANAGKSDYEKLKAYKDAICSLVTYDRDAADRGIKASGMEHWNMLYVFDGDPNTNVVCEGYAKAFQYLCDLSTFSGGIVSYLIEGDLSGESITSLNGAHMWNHVEINGRMWLVDVTNCDATSTPNDFLFLKAPRTQTEINHAPVYEFAFGNSSLGYREIQNYYGESGLNILQLDGRDYDPNYYFPVILRNNVDGYISYGSDAVGYEHWVRSGSHSGKTFQGWTGLDGLTITEGSVTDEKVTFIMPARAVDVTAVFSDIPTYTLTLISDATGYRNTWQISPGNTNTTTAGWPEGYDFKEWEGTEGLEIIEGDKTTNVIKWTMPARNVTLKTVFVYNPFTDVPTGIHYHDSVLWAVERGITNGTTPTTFSPNNTCTTANILTFLWRANGSPEPGISNPFSNVNPADAGQYYAKAAIWACEKGLIPGGTFSGGTPCTRASTMKYLWILAGSPKTGSLPFADVNPSADYAWAVAWAVQKGITNGKTPTTFVPDETCTRGQIATFLYRNYAL